MTTKTVKKRRLVADRRDAMLDDARSLCYHCGETHGISQKCDQSKLCCPFEPPSTGVPIEEQFVAVADAAMFFGDSMGASSEEARNLRAALETLRWAQSRKAEK